MSQLKFGWAEVDITPKEKIALRGEFFERVTNEVETPITVTALAIDNGEDHAVFCSCDLVGIGSSLMLLTREKLNAPGLNPDKILLNAIHTHNSYTLGDLKKKNRTDENVTGFARVLKQFLPEGCRYVPEASDPDQMDPYKALDFVSDKTAEAISLAWANRKPGGYVPGFGRAAVGMNRRACYLDGSAKMWGDVDKAYFTTLEGGNDNGIEILLIYDADKKLTGVVANIACPSQVMEQRSVISSDYWGKVKILLREKYGKDVFLLALCSPAGDQCPRDLIRWVQPETPIKDPNVIRPEPKYRRADPSMFDVKGTWTIGRRIVSELSYVIDEADPADIRTDGVLIHQTKTLPLPLRRVTANEKIAAEKGIREFFAGKSEVNYIDTAEVHVLSGILDRYEKQKNVEMFEIEAHNIRLDDIAFASCPFELFLDFANEIRARSVAAQNFLIQLSCGEGGYLPTAKAEAGGHYSAYVASGSVGHEGGDIYVRDVLHEQRKLFGCAVEGGDDE